VGVFSHETALGLYALSDILPARAEMTMPTSWKRRRLKVPDGLTLRFADLRPSDRTWIGLIPVTTVVRTIHDCHGAHSAPRFLAQAIAEAESRGLVGPGVLDDVRSALAKTEVETT
jgi:predicted transcriptional regulator of viral defense system